MDWYYAQGDEKQGPLTEDEFQGLVNAGRISIDTLVWNASMGDQWLPYGQVRGNQSTSKPSVPGGQQLCVECGQRFPVDEVIEYQGSAVCGGCKEIFFQRVKEGGLRQDEYDYGGFWIRFAAKFLDGIITSIATMIILVPAGFLMGADSEEQAMVGGLLYALFNFGFPVAYNVFFVGKFAATPGKMALGLKIIRPDGDHVTYLRALGRYFAEMLSAIILLIGYIMAAFDDEKRALHDRICDTRVVRTR